VEKAEPQPDGSIKFEKSDSFFQIAAVERSTHRSKIVPTIIDDGKGNHGDGLRIHLQYLSVWEYSGPTISVFFILIRLGSPCISLPASMCFNTS
jgi:hypothetical protein